MTGEADKEIRPPAPAAVHEGDGGPLHVRLADFEGPLDLLLHLVKKNEYDIFDIPIAQITEQYLQYLAVIQALNLDTAGDFLVLAATLMQIKSRMLLPRAETEEGEEEGEDPRAELARQLAEYLRYKQAAQDLASRELLDRDLFARRFVDEELARAQALEGRLEVSIFDLIDAFGKMLAERRIDLPHTVVAERLSVAQRIHEIMELLTARGSVGFHALFEQNATRARIIVTFLAILEMMRLSLLTAYQADRFAEIHLTLRPQVPAAGKDEPESAGSPTEPPKEE